MATGAPVPYGVVMSPSARKQLAALPNDVQDQIRPEIAALGGNPRPQGSQTLRGPSGEYRIRVGDYRIVSVIDDNNRLVGITRVAHRRDAYRP
jgi:mRNA interferase RelE/StbE